VTTSRSLLEPPAEPSAAELGNAEFARRELAAIREPVDRRMLVEAVWRATWPHDRLVLGASRLIREADKYVPGKKISVHANRGLAGIDGTISTAVGVALGSETDGTTRVVLGDLAALHDVGGMLFGVGETRPRIQVIVGNDGGGTIFDTLEVAATAPQDAIDRVLLTPQLVSFEALAAAYDWTYLRATNRGELDQALTASAGPTLIEVPLER
jgi:2-succinyl-5-enolpyruvyl-6-hydroxy-3-cyclohexene-1-carboxylate synthase